MDIKKICEEAIEYNFTAVCIPPSLVTTARRELQIALERRILPKHDHCVEVSPLQKVATVIGFPFGYSVLKAKLSETDQALSEGADELEALGRTREFQEYYLATAWSDAQPIEKLISLVAPVTGFSRGMIQQSLAEYGISDARRIADALDILELYSILERRGEEYRFRLAQLPRLVREFDGLDWQLDLVVDDLKRQAWS